MRLAITLLFVVTIFSCGRDDDGINPNKNAQIASIDLSTLPQIEEAKVIFKDSANVEKPLLNILSEAGINNIRLRLWVNPETKHSSFFEVKNLTKRLQQQGFTVMLTLHYSDEWADPGQQKKPTAWANLSFNDLRDSVYEYSKRVATVIKPEYIQIGNEINNGFLKPEGDFWERPLSFVELLEQVNCGVKDADTSIKTIVHFAGFKGNYAFFSRADSVNYDIIGLSYYPWWHGADTAGFKSEIIQMNRTFNKLIFITETAYPFSIGWNDWTNNIVGENTELIKGFEATEKGQAEFIKWLVNFSDKQRFIIGISYWEGAWVTFNGEEATNGSPWENCALFNFNNRANNALYELGKK
jgi:arabinogalactan endo-1,4-beta-galactosidase